MPVVAPRILDLNELKTAGIGLSCDSAAAGHPVRYLLDQLRSKTWRSELGWTITAGFNDLIDFQTGTVKVATIAPGVYVTAADLAAAIVAALVVADPSPTIDWAVAYTGTGFTISAASVFNLLCFSGANKAQAVWIDIGFSVAADKNGSTSYTSDTVTYQSRHWVAFSFEGAGGTVTAAVALADNLSASGTVAVRSSWESIASALTGVAGDLPNPWSETLTDFDGYRAKYISKTRHRFIAFLVSDVANAAGYAELGIVYLGTYRAPSVAYASNPYAEEGNDLSTIEQATEGAQHGDLRPEARAWGLTWVEVPDADAAIFRAFRTATPKGKDFFFDFDAGTSGAEIVYGFRATALPMPHVSGAYWTPAFVFAEALP